MQKIWLTANTKMLTGCVLHAHIYTYISKGTQSLLWVKFLQYRLGNDMHLGLTGSRQKYHILVVCLLSKSGIYSPAWLVCLCRWATWEANRLRVPGGQEAFTDRQGRIIMYCNGGLWRESGVTSPSTIQAVSLLQSDWIKLSNRVWSEHSHTEHTVPIRLLPHLHAEKLFSFSSTKWIHWQWTQPNLTIEHWKRK